MPFDFDVAMDVLEKLNPQERGAVLHAFSVILSSDGGKHGSICLYGRPLGKIEVGSIFTPDNVEVKNNRLVGVPGRRNVHFQVAEGGLFGVQIKPYEKAKPIALEKIEDMVLNRKERDIL